MMSRHCKRSEANEYWVMSVVMEIPKLRIIKTPEGSNIYSSF